MKSFLIFLFCFGINPFFSFSQNDSIGKSLTQISLYGGINDGAIRDYNISPLIYKNLGPSFGLDYERLSKNKQNLFLGNIIYKGGKGKTFASDSLTTEYIDGGLSFAWLRRATQLPKGGEFFVGGAYASSINFMQFNNVFESFTFTLSHGLSFTARAQWYLNNRHWIDLGFSSPVFSLLVRPPYSGYNNELERNLERPLRLITNNGSWVSYNKFFMMNFRARHQFIINEKFSTLFAYNFMVQSLSRVRHYDHQWTFGLSYKFGWNGK